MEPKVIIYLKRIINTLVAGLLWMASNSTLGILKGYALYTGSIKWQNVLFYIFFGVSLILFLWYIIKLWANPINFNEE